MTDLTMIISVGILGITTIASVIGYAFIANYKVQKQYGK